MSEELRKLAEHYLKDDGGLVKLDHIEPLLRDYLRLSAEAEGKGVAPVAAVYECSACGLAWYDGIQKDCGHAKNEAAYFRPPICRPHPIEFSTPAAPPQAAMPTRGEALEEAAAWCDKAAKYWRAANTGEGGPVNRALRAMQYDTAALNLRALAEEPALIAPEAEGTTQHR